MRILFILHQFYPEFSSGTERVTLNLAKAAQRAGHYAHVLACTINPSTCVNDGHPCGELAGALETVHEGVPVTLLPRNLLPTAADSSFDTNPILVEKLTVWIKNKGFNLAHVLHLMRMGSALRAVQKAQIPYFLTLTDFFYICYRVNLIDLNNQLCPGPESGARCAHNCLTGCWTTESLACRHDQARDLLAGARVRACPSEYVAARFRNTFPSLSFTVIPHGVDLLEQASTSNAAHAPQQKGLTLGFVGSVVPQKGLDTLLRAFKRVLDPSLKLRIIGGFHGDPDYCHGIKRLVDADPRVEVVGQVLPAQVFKMLATIDLLCIPSHVPESFSLVLQEAAAAGIPALVSNLGAPSEQVTRLESGRSLPFGNVDAWAKAIDEVATHPDIISKWRANLPLPSRIEEEAFFYESLYRRG